MACILKYPFGNCKGVVTFTTQERNLAILNEPALQEGIQTLKTKWVVGLHHNWHDFHFTYNPLFDFHMAGEEDLKEVSGRSFPLIPMDACNFVPPCFKPSHAEKFWDILYVARAVYFKKIPEFFQCIRSLYDQGHQFRVLLICPVAPYDRTKTKSHLYNVREIYDDMFSEVEKNSFTLLTTNFRHPFPFDLFTLEIFYRLSRVFVHTADEERRCRVVAYSLAEGLPVVGMECVGSILPRSMQQPPWFFKTTRYEEFPSKIIQAIEASKSQANALLESMKVVSEVNTIPELTHRLMKYFSDHCLPWNEVPLSSANLDIRLGRHHQIDTSSFGLQTPIRRFLEILATEDLTEIMKHKDPERALELKYPTPKASTGILNRLQFWKS